MCTVFGPRKKRRQRRTYKTKEQKILQTDSSNDDDIDINNDDNVESFTNLTYFCLKKGPLLLQKKKTISLLQTKEKTEVDWDSLYFYILSHILVNSEKSRKLL